MRRTIGMAGLSLFLALAMAPRRSAWGAAERTGGFDHAHTLYRSVLEAYVSDGWVDYTGLKRSPATLRAYLDRLAGVSKAEFGTWSRHQQMAFLINLYNAATLDLVVRHYPVKSIRDIGSFLKGPWKQEVVDLFGEKVTLDHVEHDLLRKEYPDARVHFALVCAARSCPALRGEPYTAARLDAQLDAQGRAFLAAPSKNRVDTKARVVHLSMIFKWFAGDFERQSGTVLDFVAAYLPAEEARALKEDGPYRIEYTDYDWRLNDRKYAPGPGG